MKTLNLARGCWGLNIDYYNGLETEHPFDGATEGYHHGARDGGFGGGLLTLQCQAQGRGLINKQRDGTETDRTERTR
jgi:hypothetical protein